VELGGLAIVRDKVLFETLSTDEYDRILREECSIGED
jgi:hypothetical protein